MVVVVERSKGWKVLSQTAPLLVVATSGAGAGAVVAPATLSSSWHILLPKTSFGLLLLQLGPPRGGDGDDVNGRWWSWGWWPITLRGNDSVLFPSRAVDPLSGTQYPLLTLFSMSVAQHHFALNGKMPFQFNSKNNTVVVEILLPQVPSKPRFYSLSVGVLGFWICKWLQVWELCEAFAVIPIDWLVNYLLSNTTQLIKNRFLELGLRKVSCTFSSLDVDDSFFFFFPKPNTATGVRG